MDYNGLTVLASSAADSAAIGTGTFLLADNRETVESGGMIIGNTRYKTYIVRRLADGNCWMVQNLDLNLADFTSSQSKRLTPENTDVSETWIPDASMNSREWSFNDTTITGGYSKLIRCSCCGKKFTRNIGNAGTQYAKPTWAYKRV